MHELSLCQAIIIEVNRHLQERPEANVVSIHLSIGALVAVDLDALQFCFPIAAKDTPMSTAELVITTLAAKAHCQQCKSTFVLPSRLSPCPQCQKYHYQLLSGEEFLLEKVQVCP